MNYLLPTSSFVSHMSTSLLCHESLRVREKSHLLLNARLRQLDVDKLTADEVHCLSCFVFFYCENCQHFECELSRLQVHTLDCFGYFWELTVPDSGYPNVCIT